METVQGQQTDLVGLLCAKGELYICTSPDCRYLFYTAENVSIDAVTYIQKSIALISKQGERLIAGAFFADFPHYVRPDEHRWIGSVEVREATADDVAYILNHWEERQNVPVKYWVSALQFEARALRKPAIDFIKEVCRSLNLIAS